MVKPFLTIPTGCEYCLPSNACSTDAVGSTKEFPEVVWTVKSYDHQVCRPRLEYLGLFSVPAKLFKAPLSVVYQNTHTLSPRSSHQPPHTWS